MITPADEKTRSAIKSQAKEGFGIQKTGAFLPKVIIYNVDKDIRPDELAKTIIDQNPELGLELSDKEKIQPRFKRGLRDRDIVHWVCEVRPEIFKKITNRSVYIGYSVCKVKEFLDIENSTHRRIANHHRSLTLRYPDTLGRDKTRNEEGYNNY